MSKQLKTWMQSELSARFKGIDGGIFVSSDGLNSEATYSLRKTLHGQGVKYTVVRNAFLRKVFEAAGYSGAELKKVLKGPTGVVYTTEENSAPTAAKAFDAWKRDSKDKVLQYRGAFFDGAVLGPKDAEQLKSAPGKREARAMLLGVIQAPATKLLAQIREPHARVIYLLNNWREKREEGSGAA